VNLEGTRFPVGSWCEAPRCHQPVVWANLGKKRILVDAEPTADGTVQLRDTGGTDPYAALLTTAQQFGRSGTLHRNHTPNCTEAKKYRRRR